MLKRFFAVLLALCLLLCGLPAALAEAEPSEDLRALLCALAVQARMGLAGTAMNSNVYTNDQELLFVTRSYADAILVAAEPESITLYVIEPNGESFASDSATQLTYGQLLLQSYAFAVNATLGETAFAAVGILSTNSADAWLLPRGFDAFAYAVEVRFPGDAGIFAVFSDTGHGTMIMQAQAILPGALQGQSFAETCAENGFSCQVYPCDPHQIGAPGDYETVDVEKLGSTPDSLLAAAEEAARAVAIRASDEYLRLTQPPETVIDIIARCRSFAGTPERAYYWDMPPISLSTRLNISTSVIKLPSSLTDALFCRAMLNYVLVQRSGTETYVASNMVAYGTAYRKGGWPDDHVRMVWLFYRDGETEESAALVVLFQPNGHGCVDVLTLALPEASLAEALLEGDPPLDLPVPEYSTWLAENKQILIAPEE